MLNLLIPFLTGLSTGGLTCFALQGGLFSSLILQTKEDGGSKTKAIMAFLVAKIASYSVLGLILGLVGEALSPSIKLSALIYLAASIFMTGLALETFKVHPIFRYFILQPPKFVRRYFRNNSQRSGVFAGGLLGAATVLIPCGTTQAMMALAVSSQNPVTGMLTMTSFTLGTVPIFLVFGLTAARLSQTHAEKIQKAIAIALLVLAGYTLIYSLRLFGLNPISFLENRNQTTENIIASGYSAGSNQEVQIELTDRGYIPQRVSVKKGIPVELTIVNNQAWGCIQAFVIPSLNIRRTIPPGESTVITFTPSKSGKIGFTCSMGMYYGELIVQ